MERKRTIKPGSAWLGTTIFSLLTAATFAGAVFLMGVISIWPGLFFGAIAIAFARLCWFAFPEDHKLQLWITGSALALGFGCFLYVLTHLHFGFM